MAFTKPNVNILWAQTGQVIAPATAKITQGWISEIPDFEFENWIQNRQDQFNAHVNQYGIPVWDAATEYVANKSYVQGSDGEIYRALTTHTNANPTTSPSDWVKAFDNFDTSYSKTEADDRFLNESNNLSDLTNSATARTNLSVYSKAESDGRYLNEASNLSDLSNSATARTNLGVYSKTEADAKFLDEASNLLDLPDKAVARTNLNVYSKIESDGRYLNEASNLSDLPDKVVARTNLSVYSKIESNNRFIGQTIDKTTQTVAVTTGQTIVNLTTALTTTDPQVYIDGYFAEERVFNFTVTGAAQITLGSAVEANGNLRVVQEFTQLA